MKASENERHTLPVVEEQVAIHTSKRGTETLQAHTFTHEHEWPIETELSVQELEVERIPFDRFIDQPIPDRQEGDTTIISVIKEVATVEVRLKLVEEVRITRHTRTSKVNDTIKLRRQEVIVERRRSPPDTEA